MHVIRCFKYVAICNLDVTFTDTLFYVEACNTPVGKDPGCFTD